MTLQVKYKKLENDCFNLLTVDPNPPHDINHFSRFLRLENTVLRAHGMSYEAMALALGHPVGHPGGVRHMAKCKNP